MKTIYYSRSNEVNDIIFRPAIIKFVQICGNQDCSIYISRHVRNSEYDPDKVLKASAVLVGSNLVNNVSRILIGRGTYSEILKAIALQIPVIVPFMFNEKIKFKLLSLKDIKVVNDASWKEGYAVICLDLDKQVFQDSEKDIISLLQKCNILDKPRTVTHENISAKPSFIEGWSKYNTNNSLLIYKKMRG